MNTEHVGLCPLRMDQGVSARTRGVVAPHCCPLRPPMSHFRAVGHGQDTKAITNVSTMRGPSNESVAVLAVTVSAGSFSLGYWLIRR